jgi:mRNA interferase RelE/StbE
MFQVTFSDQSLQELAKLGKLEQLDVIEPLGNMTAAQLANPREPLGRFHRDGKELYRLRSGDFRIYFEAQGETLITHYILHRKSLQDFLFRSKLPVTAEQMIEDNQSFWKYLESLRK